MTGGGNDEASCMLRTFRFAVGGAASGTLFGAVQAAWYPDPTPNPKPGTPDYTTLRGVLRCMSYPALYFSAAAASFALGECVAETLRNDKKGPFNAFCGGAVAGVVMGSISKRFDVMGATAIGTGVVCAVFDFAGDDWVVDRPTVYKKVLGELPKKHVESEELIALKEKYPKFKDL